MKKRALILLCVCLVLIAAAMTLAIMPDERKQARQSPQDYKRTGPVGYKDLRGPPITIKRILIGHDQDNDGIDDSVDIVRGARAEVRRAPRYRSAYYQGGYPPEDEGVCTDVLWRAFKDAGYDLKKLVDDDIKTNIRAYPRVGGKPDPNIDFRRVPNMESYFKRHALALSLELRPGDAKNLELWQGGDIVVFGKPYPHIGIVSDKRRRDGVPLLIHNSAPVPAENDFLASWPSPITGHYRYPKVLQAPNQ